MFKRLKIGFGATAGIAALALGGSALAGAASSTPTKAPAPATRAQAPAAAHEAPSGPDGDTVQSGDQSTPDTTAAAGATGKATAGDKADNSSAAASNTDKATAGDTADSTSSSSESSTSETATASDGPGGHADEPGNPNADNQQQGQN